MRRKRKREDARAALDGHTVLSTGSRLEIFCDNERWYPATVMAREEDGDGRIVVRARGRVRRLLREWEKLYSREGVS